MCGMCVQEDGSSNLELRPWRRRWTGRRPAQLSHVGESQSKGRGGDESQRRGSPWGNSWRSWTTRGRWKQREVEDEDAALAMTCSWTAGRRPWRGRPGHLRLLAFSIDDGDGAVVQFPVLTEPGGDHSDGALSSKFRPWQDSNSVRKRSDQKERKSDRFRRESEGHLTRLAMK